MPDAWRRLTVDGIELVRCEPLLGAALTHAFSTRRANGGDDFDLGGAAAGSPGCADRVRRFLRAAGLAGASTVALRQVHGNRVVRAARVEPETAADAVIWLRGDDPTPVPAVRTADCVPILLVEPSGAAVAAVHAGWRGTLAGVARVAVERLAASGVAPARLIAALGPAIGPCCYEVDGEVGDAIASTGGARAVSRERAVERPRVDLREANRYQLVAAGLDAGRIHLSPDCTACRTALYFSHRAEGSGAGRMLAAVGPASPAG